MDKRKKIFTAPELRLMVVGSSGSSQFLLTNAILGRRLFSKDTTSLPCATKFTGELAGRRVAVINGLNIFDKDICQAKRTMELKRSKCLCIPGPHALLIAFDLEKISPNDMWTPKLLMKRFGEKCICHCMVLLAYGGNPNKANLDDRVLELIEMFGGRFHVFNKNCKDRSQSRKLLQKLERMVESFGGDHFSNRSFRTAEDSVKKEEKKLRQEKELEAEKMWSELAKQYSRVELNKQKEAYNIAIGEEIRARAEVDNDWLRISRARGLGMGFCAGVGMGVLVGAVGGAGTMVLYGIIGGAVGGAAGGAAQVAIKDMDDRSAPPARLNFNSIFINRFFSSRIR